MVRKGEPNLHFRAFLTHNHRGTSIVDRREFPDELTGAKIDGRKLEPRDVCHDQAVSRIDQGQTISRIESSRAAKLIESDIVTSECEFITTPDRVRNQRRQMGD